MTRLFTLFLFLAYLMNPDTSTAQSTDGNRAREIFEEVEHRRNKITYEQTDMQMVIYDSRGRTRNRSLTSFSFRQGHEEKSLLVFDAPANVQGTSFLTLSDGSNEVQKLYLPALDRVQTITASQKGDRFMGSDFTYEDLGDQDSDDFEFELIEENDSEAILKAVKPESDQYAYIHFYIDTERYTLTKAEYFNEDNEMIKRLKAENFTNVDQDVWRANKMTMFDLRENRKTELVWSNRTINQEIPAWRFTERAFRRAN